MIRTFIFFVIYFTIGCIFGLSVAAFDEDLDDGVALVFAVLSVVFWPVMVAFAIVTFMVRLIRGFR